MHPPTLSFTAVVAVLLIGGGCGGSMPLSHPGLTILGGAGLSVQAGASVQVSATVAVPVRGAGVAEFFGIPLDGVQDVVFVLDRSGSMGSDAPSTLAPRPAPSPQASSGQTVVQGSPEAQPAPAGTQGTQGAQGAAPPAPPILRKIDVARDELTAALERLPDGTRLNIILFDVNLEAWAPTLVTISPSSRPSLAAFVSGVRANGGTALVPAMRAAFLMHAQRVVLLSDGLGNEGGRATDALRDAREAMLGGVRIDTIGIGSSQDRSLLAALARESGGVYQSF